MLPRIDIVGKIQQLYMEARPVPYLTFMQVLNELLADPAHVVPKMPDDSLAENFRAACMCVNVGIVDTEGRQYERVREFQDKVYTLWQSKLPAKEFARYEEIIRGDLREKRRLEAQQEADVATQQAEERSRELLDKLGLTELEQEAPAVTTAPPPVELPRRDVARRFGSVDELCGAMRAGDVAVEYSPRAEGKVFARYSLGDVEVAVKLAEAEGTHYTVLTVDDGHSDGPEAEQRVDDVAAEMGYLRMASYAYMRRDDEFVYTLKVGSHAVNAACTSAEQGAEEDVVRRVEKLHRDLGELVERALQ
jgi:hypothetical protein